MSELIAIEVAITWAAAAGCLFYLVSLYHSGDHGVGAQRFLIAVLAAVLLVRGFFWMTGDLRLARLTFAFATWLPLAITLFFERVLRRHHPLWVKFFALTVSVLFFLSDMIPGLFERRSWNTVFGVCFALVVFINGVLLLRQRDAGLLSEKRLADLLLLIAFVSAPLVLSDFRTLLPVFPIRLGGLAALLFVYALLGSAVLSLSVWMWLVRFVTLLVLALALSTLLVFALQSEFQDNWWQVTQYAWPVAFAWMLLTGIVVSRVAISSDVSNNAFLRWLSRAPLTSSADFLESLAAAPDASTHLIVQSADLRDYSTTTLARLADAENGVVSLPRARVQRSANDSALAESAEQWIDLLERLQMTHGFIAQRDPLTVTVVSLPATTSAAGAEARLRVIQNLARQLGPRG